MCGHLFKKKKPSSFICCYLVQSPSSASCWFFPNETNDGYFGLNIDLWEVLRDILTFSVCVAVSLVETCGSSGLWSEIFSWFDVHSDLQEIVAVDQDETKDQKATGTPPSTPVRAEEGKVSCHTWRTQHALLGLGFVAFWSFWPVLVCTGHGLSWLSSCLPVLGSVHVAVLNITTFVAMFSVITDQEA